MSMHDLEAFLRSIHPFELLSKAELNKAMSAMNIAYYKKDEILFSPSKPSAFLFMIIKGEVGEFSEDELLKVYSKSNCFDADALIYGKTQTLFKVLEELICYELDKQSFLALLDSNPAFKTYFIQDLANKIQSIKQKEYTTELSGFMMAHVRDCYIHTPTIVEKECSIMEALREMEVKRSSCIVVRLEEGYGIVTDSVIRKHVLFNDYDKHGCIGTIALSPLLCIEADEYLFNALLSFTKHAIKRLVVMDEGKIIGILEQLDLLSYFANHSYLVAVKIKKAGSIEELKEASEDFIHIIKKLHVKGTKVDYIAKLISELNAKVYEKLYTMIVPEDLASNACLVVMGSEGRKEQLLKTDQDNALIIDDAMDEHVYVPYMQRLTQTLIDFGFPPCEGNIMVSNAYWCKHKSAYHKEIERWFDTPTMEDVMHLAIFVDAHAVAGNSALLTGLKKEVFRRIEAQTTFMAHFAMPVLAFETPIGFFANFIANENKIDVKKGGIFPIVHGIRSLALEQKIEVNDTVGRIKKLAQKGVLESDFSGALIEALDTFLNLRLKAHLQKGTTTHFSNHINLEALNELELELLKDSFKIVNKFKKFLTHHFKLSMVS
ncbi:MAG: CBS domain-containing protein [Epsilonproteobacteria bacterium]|nr:CBS domain-containing protein [Campylobacterota bacterium]